MYRTRMSPQKPSMLNPAGRTTEVQTWVEMHTWDETRKQKKPVSSIWNELILISLPVPVSHIRVGRSKTSIKRHDLWIMPSWINSGDPCELGSIEYRGLDRGWMNWDGWKPPRPHVIANVGDLELTLSASRVDSQVGIQYDGGRWRKYYCSHIILLQRMCMPWRCGNARTFTLQYLHAMHHT